MSIPTSESHGGSPQSSAVHVNTLVNGADTLLALPAASLAAASRTRTTTVPPYCRDGDGHAIGVAVGDRL